MSEKKTKKSWFRILLPVLILILAVVMFRSLLKMKPRAGKENKKALPTLVEVVNVQRLKKQITFESNGLVIPAKTVRVLPQVGGRVSIQNQKLVPGGIFKKGESLLKIEDVDYRLRLSQEQAGAAQAKLNYQLEKARTFVAKKEWRLAKKIPGVSRERKELVLRKPYLDAAEAQFRAAESRVKLAELNLSRTEIRAPFNAIVQSENVEKGQNLGPQSPVATLIGTDEFWVEVSLPVNTLNWIDLPSKGKPGSQVKVFPVTNSGAGDSWSGEVVRILGELSRSGRMATLVVKVVDPLAL